MRHFNASIARLICLFIIGTCQLQAEGIERYLYPKPQKIAFSKTTKSNGYSSEDIDEMRQFMQSSLFQKIEGEIILHLKSGKSFQIQFKIDTTRLAPQAYKIKLEGNQVKLTGHQLAGLFYAKQTCIQVLNYHIQEQLDLTHLEIHDWPNFARRGYMLDISRDKVPTMATLYQIIDQLSSWKVNEFQLYVEHSFAYKNHETVWKNASPLLPEEIKQLDQYCKERYIDLVPNQNSFGHMENWLKHDEYLHLAECPDDCNTVWGMRKRSSLNPTDPRSLELMQELYAEYLPNFSSAFFNIGCDETVELGLGRSKDSCKQIGQGQVYLNYLTKLNEAANAHGKQAQFWGDIIENYPKLISKLPTNMTALVWGYEADYPFEKKLPKFKKASIPFYVCPGTSSWRSLIGKNPNAFENLRNAASYGMKNKAVGFLNTDWGDYGHWQPLSISYPSLLLGAEYAWNYQETSINYLESQVNEVFFKDTTGRLAAALFRLGNAYQKAKVPEGNANIFHQMLHRYKWTLQGNPQTKVMTKEGLLEAEMEILAALDSMKYASLKVADSTIILEEIRLAAELALHGIHLGLARLDAKDQATANIALEVKQALIRELQPLIERHKKLWMVRNRPGGLDDSAGKLQEILDYYRMP